MFVLSKICIITKWKDLMNIFLELEKLLTIQMQFSAFYLISQNFKPISLFVWILAKDN